jgi:hypothetical protein
MQVTKNILKMLYFYLQLHNIFCNQYYILQYRSTLTIFMQCFFFNLMYLESDVPLNFVEGDFVPNIYNPKEEIKI